MPSYLNKRVATLETQAITVQRSTLPGLVALLERGLLTMGELTDSELAQIVATSVPGDEWVQWDELTNDQLERIAAGTDPRWVLGGEA